MIRCYGQSLEPQARSKHRAWIGVRVQALLANYWQSMPDEATLSLIFQDWIDALDHFTPEEITKACRDWVSREPRRRPNFGDISALIVADRSEKRRKLDQLRVEVEEPRQCSEERRKAAQDILSSFGFKSMGGAS